jgi:hypothetical protein
MLREGRGSAQDASPVVPDAIGGSRDRNNTRLARHASGSAE